jgi:hypothetical protein
LGRESGTINVKVAIVWVGRVREKTIPADFLIKIHQLLYNS